MGTYTDVWKPISEQLAVLPHHLISISVFLFHHKSFSRAYFLEGSVSCVGEVDQKFEVENVDLCKRKFSVVSEKRL